MKYDDFVVSCASDRPKGGMWHNGPNPCWVKVTHKPTGISATAYRRNQQKAREDAMAACQLMVGMAIADGTEEASFLERLEEL